ncbi:hypothetical protein BDR22DRAFT_817155 [Usnea florida]
MATISVQSNSRFESFRRDFGISQPAPHNVEIPSEPRSSSLGVVDRYIQFISGDIVEVNDFWMVVEMLTGWLSGENGSLLTLYHGGVRVRELRGRQMKRKAEVYSVMDVHVMRWLLLLGRTRKLVLEILDVYTEFEYTAKEPI